MSEHTTPNAGFRYYDDGDNAAGGVNWNTGYNANWAQLDGMAGDGLAWDTSSPKKLAVQVDGSTLEISGDSLRVKDGLPLTSATIATVYGSSASGGSLTLESTQHATKGSILFGSAAILTADGNLGLGATSFGTSAAKVLAIANGTEPTTSPADTVQIWAADRSSIAGKASLQIRTETGARHVIGDYVGILTTNPQQALDVYGNIDVGGSDKVDAHIQINARGTSGYAYIDMSVAGGNADYDFRVMRTTGANGVATIYNRGTGGLSFNLNSVANILVMTASGNIGIGAWSFGTSAAKVLSISNGTAPTTAPADLVQLWSADINGAAGKAGLHMLAESGTSPLVVVGAIIKGTTGDPSQVHEGLMCINTTDNTLKMFCDGAWRTLATW